MGTGGSRMGAGRPALHVKAEYCMKLDIRRWHREGVLRQGVAGSWTWRQGDEVVGTIGYRVDSCSVALDYSIDGRPSGHIFKLAGLDRPNIGILSDAFLDEVRQLPQKNFAVELLQKLLNDEVRSRSRTNVVLERKFGDRIQAVLNRYRARAVESEQVIEELIAMAKEFREAAKRGDELGLNESELAFYDALANNESAVRDLGDSVLKLIAQELTQRLRNSTIVDWHKRESVRARLRNLVRITLRRHKYPPETNKKKPFAWCSSKPNGCLRTGAGSDWRERG
jgi:hypothetical protein